MAEVESYEKISVSLSKVLDGIGYNKEMVQFRIEAYQEYDMIINKYSSSQGCEILTSGSKREGLSKPFESDVDRIYLSTDTVCIEDGMAYAAPPRTSILTFRPDYEYPGYSLLKLRNLDTCATGPQLAAAVRPVNDQNIISSDSFLDGYVEFSTEEQKESVLSGSVQLSGRSGPAASTEMQDQSFDHVICLPVVAPTVMLQWQQRPRKYDWPPLHLRKSVAGLKGNFAAKGCKQSPLAQHEWRLCFSQVELALVHSLEDTLHKLYILLKSVLKDLLRPLDKESFISSYIMKNIVFWLAETTPPETCQEHHLVKLFMDALGMLKDSLEKKHLSNYMIPGRNLINPDIDMAVRETLIERVESLMKEGPRFLYSCEKFRCASKLSKSELVVFGQRRNELEKTHLSIMNYMTRLQKQEVALMQMKNDETLRTMQQREIELTFSTWPPYLQEELDACEDVWKHLSIILK